MGLGSLQTAPLLNQRFRKLTERHSIQRGKLQLREQEDGGEREGRELQPSAEKYARLCNPTPAVGSAFGGKGQRGSNGFETQTDMPLTVSTDVSKSKTDVSGWPGSSRSSPLIPDVLMLKKDLRSPDAIDAEDFEVCSENQEGSRIIDSNAARQDGHEKREDEGKLSPATSASFSSELSAVFLSSSCCPIGGVPPQSRRLRTFTPEERKDQTYWEKRRKNNQAARKSREKRRFQDLMLENRIVDLEEDNHLLRLELNRLKAHYGLPQDTPAFPDTPDPAQDRMNPTPILHHHQVSNEEDILLSRTTPVSELLPPRSVRPVKVPRSSATPRVGMFSSSQSPSSSFPLFMPAAAIGELPCAQTLTFPTISTPTATTTTPVMAFPWPPPPAAHQQGVGVTVKREPATDEYRQETLLLSNPPSLLTLPLHNQDGAFSECKGTSPEDAASYSNAAALHRPTACFDAVSASYIQTVPPPLPWHSSPLSRRSSEELPDEPLELTVHSSRRGSKGDRCLGEETGTESIKIIRNNEHSTNADDRKTPILHSIPSVCSLPPKLRRKMPLDASTTHWLKHEEWKSTEESSSLANGFVPGHSNACRSLSPRNGQNCEDAETIRDSPPLSLVKTEPDDSSEEKSEEIVKERKNQDDSRRRDSKYLERRRRNNEAARKCRRRNRRNPTRPRECQSDQPVTENSQLRQDLTSLQQEMRQLREVLGKSEGQGQPEVKGEGSKVKSQGHRQGGVKFPQKVLAQW